ncbi:MAG TPA: type 4a pilus biogenesis protein PilO [Gemmatimonadales bacterium]|nr:type 4a pilus biogenesis protein PilO [Gemmatimonadales bacterium]
MAFGIPKDTRGQILFLIIVACLAGGYFLWDLKVSKIGDQVAETQRDVDSLNAIVKKAKADLASGSVESMRAAVEQYRAALGRMRQLVPEQNEVPTLIDDISTKAKLRGITVGRFAPLSVEPGPGLALKFQAETTSTGKKKPPEPAFDIYRYRLEVYGHYDQLGEFITDVASLGRIMVPQDVVLKPAAQGTQKLLSDTLGALLEANLTLRTYVKRKPSTPAAGGTNATH